MGDIGQAPSAALWYQMVQTKAWGGAAAIVAPVPSGVGAAASLAPAPPCRCATQGKGDVFELADKILEAWYPTVEIGDKRGVVLLVTSAKEGALAGGPTFLDTVGDDLIEAIVSENLPGACAISEGKGRSKSDEW